MSIGTTMSVFWVPCESWNHPTNLGLLTVFHNTLSKQLVDNVFSGMEEGGGGEGIGRSFRELKLFLKKLL